MEHFTYKQHFDPVLAEIIERDLEHPPAPTAIQKMCIDFQESLKIKGEIFTIESVIKPLIAQGRIELHYNNDRPSAAQRMESNGYTIHIWN